MIRVATVAGVVAGVLAAAAALHGAPALAHHSFAMFDQTKTVTLTGAVKELQWTAPHVMIWLIADPREGESAGEGKLWSVELSTSPGPLARQGWNRQSVVPGDRVTIEVNPLRTGNPGGAFRKLTILSTGQVLAAGGIAPDPNAPTQPPVQPASAETK
jgi:hypothetical protein